VASLYNAARVEDIGGWETHTDMGDGGDPNSNFNSHVRDFSDAIGAFAGDLGDLLNSTTIVTWSEFGRRPYSNDSNGTDHGHGNAMLLLGGGINGGRYYANWPTLTEAARDQYDGNIGKGTDIRDVWGSVYRRLGIADPNVVFGDPNFRYTDLGIVNQA